MMKNYLDKSDELRVEVRELQLLMGPEDSEVNLTCILTQASRRGSRRWHLQYEWEKWPLSGKLTPLSQPSEEKDCDQGDLCWTEAREVIARGMLKCLENSEIVKVSMRELEDQVLSPNEPRINVVRIARQARNEMKEKLFQIFRQREGEVLIAI